jgi:outer membrane protein assembly factor BamB
MTPAVANGTVFIGAGDHSFYAIDAATGLTSGSNGSFAAGPGWDACTGLGSPVGTKLLAAAW